jgi:hypothetical protein
MGLALPERDLILSHLAGIAVLDRQLFSDALYGRRYDGNVPGIARRDSRPWH